MLMLAVSAKYRGSRLYKRHAFESIGPVPVSLTPRLSQIPPNIAFERRSRWRRSSEERAGQRIAANPSEFALNFPPAHSEEVMETTRLGKTGLKVSRICLGTMTYGSPNWRDWVLGEEESRPFIKKALEAGINFFDSADVYSLGRSEEIVGKALKDFASSRDRVVIATKVCGVMSDDVNDRGLSRKHILHSIDNSLRRLQTDYVDLYQIHRFDPTTPIEETIEALHDVVKSGKARYIGASSMYAWQFSKYLHTQERLGAA